MASSALLDMSHLLRDKIPMTLKSFADALSTVDPRALAVAVAVGVCLVASLSPIDLFH